MKKKLIIALLIIISCIFILLYAKKNVSMEVEFNNKSFQNAFETVYIIPQHLYYEPTEEKLVPTKKQLESMQSLKLDFKENKEYQLYDLDKFPNLHSLYIVAETISGEQLEYISQMADLEILVLLINDKNINYDALVKLKKLKQLVISNCNDTTIQFISRLPELELFGLNNSEILNLDFLNKQNNLKYLSLRFVDITKILSAEPFGNLEELVLYNVTIEEHSDLLLYTINPRILELQFCEFITNLDFLKNMTILEEVTLINVGVNDLSIFLEMQHFPRLRSIHLLPDLKDKNKLILNEVYSLLKKRNEVYLTEMKEYTEMEQWELPADVKFPVTIKEMKEYGIYVESEK